ncbi:MgtC/SapB family protein [Salinarimonas sp.]|uniref:MgtC/SapB family protein n=1 Tax=Salinarimonas sp. TaxID=2766526 RepID=UPI00391C6AD0
MDELQYMGAIPLEGLALRLGLAALGGMLLGLDRELRGRATGLRTHGMVALSSCVITVSAFLVYEEAIARDLEYLSIDPLRVIQGLAQAIGFIAAGAIFVAKGDVHNLTSAANLWLAAAVGIALGAGQYALAGLALGFGLLLMTFMRVVERFMHRRLDN